MAINVKIENDTIWLTLNQISDLFYKNKSRISRHVNNIYKEEELNLWVRFRLVLSGIVQSKNSLSR